VSWRHARLHLRSLPFRQFQALLTLFSKSFASFPHGTCSLSVSDHYLALEGVYLPLWIGLPNNPTLRIGCTRRSATRASLRGCHPLRHPVPGNLPPGHGSVEPFTKLQFGGAGTPDSELGLFPLHSQLLRKSWLVSCPPLINMLKFSG